MLRRIKGKASNAGLIKMAAEVPFLSLNRHKYHADVTIVVIYAPNQCPCSARCPHRYVHTNCEATTLVISAWS